MRSDPIVKPDSPNRRFIARREWRRGGAGGKTRRDRLHRRAFAALCNCELYRLALETARRWSSLSTAHDGQ